MTETIARMVRREFDENTIPAYLPGVKIEKIAGGIILAIDDNLQPKL